MNNRAYPYYDIPQVKTLREVIEFGRDTGGEKTIFYRGKQESEPLSFITVSRYIEYIGTHLLSLGYAGSHIAILGENSSEWSLTYFGIVNSGNVVVPLDKSLPKEDLAELIRSCGCSALFFSEGMRKNVEYFRALEEPLPIVQYFSLEDFDTYMGHGRALVEGGNTAFRDVVITPDTLACIVYTSGTSGKSKGVMLSHGNLATDVAATCQCVTARNTMILLPMNHTFSWASSMFAAFLYNVDAHISGNLKRIVKDLTSNKPQNISAVPMMVELINKNIWATAKKTGREKKLKNALKLSRFLMKHGIDLRRRLFFDVHESLGGHLETIICGGAALDSNLQRTLFDMGINVINGYGITECSPVVAVNRNNHFRFGSVGLPLPCNKVMIHEPDKDGIGEVYVSGSNVMLGYYNDPEATAEAFDGEWFKTGDYGRLDKDGFLYITGRKKNLIILSNGKNVSPEELEQKLSRLPYVAEVAVYEESGHIVGEFYLDTAAYPDAKEQLDADVKAFNHAEPPYKNISEVRVREIPFEKTTTLKIKRYLLCRNKEDGESNKQKEESSHV